MTDDWNLEMIRTLKKPLVTSLCFLALLPVSMALGQSSGQADGLRWKLEKGDQFGIVLVQSSNSETRIDARETTIESATTIGMDWEVTEVGADGDATIEQSLTSVKLSVTGFTRVKKGETASPLMTISFDTAAPDGITSQSKKLMKQIEPLLGLKFEVVMSVQGEIKDVMIPDNLAAQLEKMPDTQNLRALFSKSGLKELLGASAIVLPSDLTVGQTWTDESKTATALGNFNRLRTYTFVGRSTVDGKEVAEFSVASTLAPSNPANTKIASDSLDSKLIDFNGSGTLLLDVEDGFFRTSNIENRAHSEKPYREKLIDTVVTNSIEMTVTKK